MLQAAFHGQVAPVFGCIVTLVLGIVKKRGDEQRDGNQPDQIFGSGNGRLGFAKAVRHGAGDALLFGVFGWRGLPCDPFVVFFAFVRRAENFVGKVDDAHDAVGIGVVGICVGVVLFAQCTIGCADGF